MAPIRKYLSGAEKQKQRMRREAFQRTQVGSLNKYFSRIERAEPSVMNEIEDEAAEHSNADMNENETSEHDIASNENGENDQTENEEDNEIGNNENVQTAGSSEEINFPSNMDDPGNWNTINQNIRDFLVERGHKRDSNVIFPKDHLDRCFTIKHYFRDLPNGEKVVGVFSFFGQSLLLLL